MPFHNVLIKLKLHILIPFNDKIICVVINMIMFWQSCFGVNFRGGTWSAPQLFVFLYSSFSSTSSAASLTRILRLLRLPFFPSSQLPWDKYTNTNTQIQILIQIHKYKNINAQIQIVRRLSQGYYVCYGCPSFSLETGTSIEYLEISRCIWYVNISNMSNIGYTFFIFHICTVVHI